MGSKGCFRAKKRHWIFRVSSPVFWDTRYKKKTTTTTKTKDNDHHHHQTRRCSFVVMSFESPENDDDDDDAKRGRLTLSTRGAGSNSFPWYNNDFSPASGTSRGGGGGWNYMTHQYFAEERHLENWAPNDADEDLWDDEDAEGRGRAQQQQQQQRGYNLNYARQQRAMQLRRQREYRRRIEQQQFRTSRIFCDDDDEERREAQEAFRDVPDEHNKNRNGGIAILSQTKRAILVDVKGITDKEGKLCSKYVLECELPGVGIQNISFKTTKCTDREGCVFSIEVTRRKEHVKEKENVWRKVMMQKKKRTSPSNSRRRTKKLSKEKKLRIEPNEALIENMCKGGCIFLEDTR